MATVVIQPDAAAGKDSWVTSELPNDNYGTHAALVVGQSSTYTYRAFLGFMLDSLATGEGVNTATLTLTLEAGSAGTHDVTVHEIEEAWEELVVTYNNQPSVGSTLATTGVGNKALTTHDWIISALVKQWRKGGDSYGVALKGVESGTTSKQFYSSDAATASYRPKLTVETTARPTVAVTSPSGTQASPTEIEDDTTPDLVGVYSSTDSVDMEYRQHIVYDELGNTVWDSGKVAQFVAAGGTVTVTVPVGYLRYGRKYYWKWMAYDENGGSSEYSDTKWFICQLTEAPAATDLAGGKHLYAITPTGRVVALEEGTTNLGGNIVWREVFTVPITRQEDWAGPIFYLTRVKARLKLPVGSQCSAQYSVRIEDEGDGSDWLTVYAFTAAAGIQIVDIPVPFASGEDNSSNHFRFRLSGIGPHELHAIVFEYEEAEV